VCGYTKLGPVCVTWGRKQQMSWAFFRKYCDEAYAIIDAMNTLQKRAMLNDKVLDAFLATVSKPHPGRRATKTATKGGAKTAAKTARTRKAAKKR
jgi:hypothetical protein